MSFEGSQSRRKLLQVSGALFGTATLGSLSGCLDETSEPDQRGESRIDAVPADATAVYRADGDALLSDSALKDAIDDRLGFLTEQEYYDGPTSIRGLFGLVEEEAGIDPREIDDIVVFAAVDGGESYGGIVVWSGWSEAELTDALETTGLSTGEEREYGGKTVYGESDYTMLGVLDSGQYVFGTQDAAKDVIDRTNGEMNPVSGPVRDHYTATSGMVRFATATPESWVPTHMDEIDLEPLADIEYIAGSLSKQGSDRRAAVTLHTDSQREAAEIESVLDSGLDLAQRRVGETLDSEGDQAIRPLLADLDGVLDEIAVSTDGTTASLGYTGPPEDAALLVALPLGLAVTDAGLGRRKSGGGGEEAEQVTNRIQILAVSGRVRETDGERTVGTVEMIATKAPGADDIDLTGVTMQWVDDSGTYDIVHESEYAGTVDGQFTVEPIKDEDDSLPVINSGDDRAMIVIDLDGSDGTIRTGGLAEGTTASVRLTTLSGTASTVQIVVPESLAGNSAVRL